jgi:hypothetical protein
VSLIHLADQVVDLLGAENATRLRAGELVATSQYQCLVCRTDGDLTRDASCGVLLTTDVSMTVVWVHHRCGPSEVLPHYQLAARYGRPDDPTDGPCCLVPDTTATTLVSIKDVIYPALVIIPGSNLRLVESPARIRDQSVEEMRAQGFGRLDFAGRIPPVRLTRWLVVLRGGCLTEIWRPGTGAWWQAQSDTPLDADWLAAAGKTRRVLLILTATAMPEGDLPALRAAMVAAADGDRLVAALVSIRGV